MAYNKLFNDSVKHDLGAATNGCNWMKVCVMSISLSCKSIAQNPGSDQMPHTFTMFSSKHRDFPLLIIFMFLLLTKLDMPC